MISCNQCLRSEKLNLDEVGLVGRTQELVGLLWHLID